MRHNVKCALMILLCLLLTACGGPGGSDGAEQLALEIRAEYIAMSGCSASMELTADYGQRVYVYNIDCTYVKNGETVLTVTAPENIAGIIARLEHGKTTLEYDGARVETGPVAPEGMSPVDAVPALLDYVQTGFLAECVMEDLDGIEALRFTCRDPETAAGSGMEAQLWFDANSHALLRGELSTEGFTVIQCAFTSFQLTE